MPRYFDEQTVDKSAWRAIQIWQILAGCAHNQQIITYKQLANTIGFNGAGVFANILDYIMRYCEQNKLPPLTALVVRQDSGSSGDGLTTTKKYVSNDAARIKVFAENWYKIVPPTVDELKDLD